MFMQAVVMTEMKSEAQYFSLKVWGFEMNLESKANIGG